MSELFYIWSEREKIRGDVSRNRGQRKRDRQAEMPLNSACPGGWRQDRELLWPCLGIVVPVSRDQCQCICVCVYLQPPRNPSHLRVFCRKIPGGHSRAFATKWKRPHTASCILDTTINTSKGYIKKVLLSIFLMSTMDEVTKYNVKGVARRLSTNLALQLYEAF